MKNKKAFTLIELLAVIVILGVLAVIIVPKVQKTIRDSKAKTNLASANGLLRSADSYYTNKKISENFQDCSYDFENNTNTCTGLEFKGAKPESGILNISSNGEVSMAIRFEDTCYKKSFDEENITPIDYDSNDCKAQTFNGWTGTSEEVIPQGNIYYISESKQLAWISEQTASGNTFEGKKIVLTNDINMGAHFDEKGNLLDDESHAFTPIGTYEYKFKGDFDGNNHKIYNLYIKDTEVIDGMVHTYYGYVGLIGRYQGNEIKNLTVENSYINTPDSGAGIIGFAEANNTTLNIENIKSINNTIEALDMSGGIVGRQNAGEIKNCYSNSTVLSTAGGILTSGSFAGGIVGYSFGTTNIENNINDGTVIGKDYSVGGIAGIESGAHYVKNNINNGTVQGEKKWIGGIAGIHNTNAENIPLVIYSGNINNGEIKSSKGAFRIAGILGNGNNGILLVNNINTGNINGVGDGTNTCHGVAGIVGSFSNVNHNSYVYSNYNKGNITGTVNAGGIAGNVYDGTTTADVIKNVLNEGTVEAGYAGGIIGAYDKTNTSSNYVSDFITSAYNKGKIKGTNAAGLVGRNIGIKNSISVGTLEGTNNYAVIGNAPAGVNIQNVYYPNTQTSSYGTSIDITTLNDTTLSNILGNGFYYNNGTVKLYKANITTSGEEISSYTFTTETLN